ncbi:unnamed protein product [Phytophthora fragariaefolia]|uniref:Unnamed protein product n=1 Tax=Phytophthora fragariaefolia TaxID=1490495 RepID=A0A9W6YAI9_9STRA|nr:unnamed protein product [Phytophthora fragariaefolia]
MHICNSETPILDALEIASSKPVANILFTIVACVMPYNIAIDIHDTTPLPDPIDEVMAQRLVDEKERAAAAADSGDESDNGVLRTLSIEMAPKLRYAKQEKGIREE